MKFKAKIIIIFSLVLVCCIGYERQNYDNKSLQPNHQSTTKASITLSDPAIEVTPAEKAVEVEPTNTVVTKEAARTITQQQAQKPDSSIGKISLSKSEITSGKIVSGGVTGGPPPEYTLESDEVGEIIDNINSFNLTEIDREGTSQIHTALSDSINVELFKHDGTMIIITTYWDGETDVTDDKGGYALFNKELADYIISLRKYIYQVDATTGDALEQ